MIFSDMRIPKALIKLRKCVGWSVSLLFTNPKDMFYRAVVDIESTNEPLYLCWTFCISLDVSIKCVTVKTEWFNLYTVGSLNIGF